MSENLYISRYFNHLDEYLHPGKALIIFGPRQAGKTTLLKHYLANSTYRYKLDSGDNVSIQALLANADFKTIQDYTTGYDLIVIDEAQKIPQIGQCLKIMVDQLPHLRIIVSGSSSFELAGQIGEPLTGRKKNFNLVPYCATGITTNIKSN